MLYRYYADRGYVKRIRVYDIKHLSCKKTEISEEDLDKVFDSAVSQEKLFIQDEYQRTRKDYFDDFRINQT